APNIDDLDGFDALPTSADVLPTAIDDLPIPAKAAVRDLPRSADILPTPVETLGLDLDLDDDRSAHRPPPKTGPTATADGAPKPPSKASPAVVATERPRRDIARYVVYGVLGLAVLVVGGGYVAMEMGLLDPEPPPPATKRGTDEPDQQPTPPTGEPTE